MTTKNFFSSLQRGKLRTRFLAALLVLGLSILLGAGALPQMAYASATQSQSTPKALKATACPYGVTNTQVTANLIPDMQRLNSCWVRLQINANPKDLNLNTMDGYIHQLHAAGLRIDAVLRCFQGRSNCFQQNLPPSSLFPTPQQFASFATMIAKRYGDQISSYEVLNEEPDSSSAFPATQYCAILKAGYQAIKAVTPGATVGMYGTLKVGTSSPAGGPRLNSVVAGLKPCANFMDYANLHYYAGGGDPNHPNQGQLSFEQAITILKGLGKPIWVTETGWPISNSKLVTFMKEELDDARTSKVVTHVFWFTLDFPQANPPQADDIHFSPAALAAMKSYIAAHPSWP